MEFLLLIAIPSLLSMMVATDLGEEGTAEGSVGDDPERPVLDLSEPNILPDQAEPNNIITPTGQYVSDDLFGTNAVYTVHTDGGEMTGGFQNAIETFEIENLRFPAGQAEGFAWQVEGEDWIDITTLSEDGALRAELTNFLSSVEGGVTLTIPTTNAPLDGYGTHLATWTTLVMDEYGEKIDAIEIGNEYWAHMDEHEYGERANIAVLAIANGMENAGVGDADILVQMASPHAESAFHQSVDNRGYGVRVQEANQAIIDQLDPAARAEIDGVVEHYYWSQSAGPFQDDQSETNFMNLDIAVWDENFDHELDFHITEWNIRMSDDDCNGLQGVGVLIEMVENMVELGVDSAAVWPITHNTTNDLGGPAHDGEVRTDDQGRVIHTVRGAIFDLMSHSLPGMERIELDLETVDDDFEIAAYEHDGRFTFYISNNSLTVQDIAIDLRALLPAFEGAFGVQIGYDTATSDGRIYSPQNGSMIDANAVSVGGDDHYINEHDTGAVLTDHTFDTPVFNVTLSPFEVIEITAW